MHKLILKARAEAIRHQYDERMSYRLCALIVRGGNILSVGHNSLKLNSFIENSAQRAGYGERVSHLGCHAEVNAILKVRNKIDLRGSKIFVARIRPQGLLGMAKPCKLCQHVLTRYGIQRALFSIDENSYGVMKL